MTKGYTPPHNDNAPKQGEVYKHHKGDLYEIVDLAIHSNEDIWMVVYKPLYENPYADMFTRPLVEWDEEVTWEGGTSKRFMLQPKNL